MILGALRVTQFAAQTTCNGLAPMVRNGNHGDMRETYLDTTALAEWFGISPEAVRAWRKRGVGPRAMKIGGAVRYAESDVLNWIKQTNGLA